MRAAGEKEGEKNKDENLALTWQHFTFQGGHDQTRKKETQANGEEKKKKKEEKRATDMTPVAIRRGRGEIKRRGKEGI